MNKPKPPVQRGLTLLTVIYLVPSLVALGIGGWLHLNNLEGWGYWLFAAVVLWCVPSKG